MGIERRLKLLEDRSARDEDHEVPIEVRVLLKAVARLQAPERGDDPPAYTQDELEELLQQDLEILDGKWREMVFLEPGWQSSEARELLDVLEEDARRRVTMVESGTSLSSVYELEDDDLLEGDG